MLSTKLVSLDSHRLLLYRYSLAVPSTGSASFLTTSSPPCVCVQAFDRHRNQTDPSSKKETDQFLIQTFNLNVLVSSFSVEKLHTMSLHLSRKSTKRPCLYVYGNKNYMNYSSAFFFYIQWELQCWREVPFNEVTGTTAGIMCDKSTIPCTPSLLQELMEDHCSLNLLQTL